MTRNLCHSTAGSPRSRKDASLKNLVTYPRSWTWAPGRSHPSRAVNVQIVITFMSRDSPTHYRDSTRNSTDQNESEIPDIVMIQRLTLL
jgi:hypothetical protein